MIDDLPQLIGFGVMLCAVGYAAGNARRLSLWAFLLVLFIIGSLVEMNQGDKPMIYTLLGSFLAGYLLAKAVDLDGFGRAINSFINNFRYRSEKAEIARELREAQELKKNYEKLYKEQLRQRAEEERNRRREQTQNNRRSHSGGGSESSDSGNRSSKSDSSYQQSKSDTSSGSQAKPPGDSQWNEYLECLGLVPGREYSKVEVRRAYQRMTSKLHPDKHQDKPAEFIKQITAQLQQVLAAYDWLKRRVDD